MSTHNICFHEEIRKNISVLRVNFFKAIYLFFFSFFFSLLLTTNLE